MLLITHDDVVVAGGAFTLAGGAAANHLARWNGSSWSPLGAGVDGTVRALLELPNGDLLVGGDFQTAGGAPAANLARWDGATWSEVAGGTNGPVLALAQAADGTIWVGGEFTAAGAFGCGYVARLVTPCPASASVLGQGCTGANGIDQLTPTSLPWLGSTFTSQASGLPTNGIALALAGELPISVPLAWIVPQSSAGCEVRTLPIQLDLYVPTNGAASVHLPLPAAPLLVGQQFLQQVVTLELGMSAAIVDATSSNALLLTVGRL